MTRTAHDPVRPRSHASVAPAPRAMATGSRPQLPVVAPNAWLGECGCMIGPFERRRVAEAFANAMVEFGQYEGICERVVIHDEAFYVQAVAIPIEEAVVA